MLWYIMWGFRDRVWNTLWVAPRLAWSSFCAVSDTARTALYWVLDPIEGLGNTASKIKDAIHNACNEKKWYHRLWKVPTSLIASPLMAVEWIWETLFHTWYNICKNTKDTIANLFCNIGHSFKWIWSKEDVGNFKFQSIEEKSKCSPKMRLASLFSPNEESQEPNAA